MTEAASAHTVAGMEFPDGALHPVSPSLTAPRGWQPHACTGSRFSKQAGRPSANAQQWMNSLAAPTDLSASRLGPASHAAGREAVTYRFTGNEGMGQEGREGLEGAGGRCRPPRNVAAALVLPWGLSRAPRVTRAGASVRRGPRLPIYHLGVQQAGRWVPLARAQVLPARPPLVAETERATGLAGPSPRPSAGQAVSSECLMSTEPRVTCPQSGVSRGKPSAAPGQTSCPVSLLCDLGPQGLTCPLT